MLSDPPSSQHWALRVSVVESSRGDPMTPRGLQDQDLGVASEEVSGVVRGGCWMVS